MLTIKHLTVTYGQIPVLDRLNLSLVSNLIHGIVGLNGSGKTTLFNAIYGFLKPEYGTIEWNGQAVSRKHIALLDTQNFFYSLLTAREYLELFPSPEKPFNLEIWKDIFHLPLDELTENYSSGMKKKLALLGVLKLDKPVYLLDEPFNGVDIESSQIIKLVLQKLRRKNKTIVVTSHILESLTNMCDYIHHLENRVIIKTYQKEDLGKVEAELFSKLQKRTVGLIEKAM